MSVFKSSFSIDGNSLHMLYSTSLITSRSTLSCPEGSMKYTRNPILSYTLAVWLRNSYQNRVNSAKDKYPPF